MDLNKFLDELGFSGEDRASVEKAFTANPAAVTKAAGFYENGLRQSDYDRKMNMLKAEVDAQRSNLTEAERTLLASRDTMNSQYTQALKDREEAENKLASLQSRIKNVATQYQVPVDEFGLPKDGEQPPPVRTTPANNNQPDPQYASRQDFETLTDLTKRLPMLPIELMDIAQQYTDAFGTMKGFSAKAVVDKSLELQKPVGHVADLMYGLTAKQTEKHEATIRADERAKAETEFKAKYSREGANVIRPDLQTKPGAIFELKRPETAGVPGPRPDRTQSGVEAAVNAFREGKYRPQGQTA